MTWRCPQELPMALQRTSPRRGATLRRRPRRAQVLQGGCSYWRWCSAPSSLLSPSFSASTAPGTDRRNLPPSSSAPWVFRTRFWACLSIGRISMLLFRSCVSGTKSIWSRHETQALQGCF